MRYRMMILAALAFLGWNRGANAQLPAAFGGSAGGSRTIVNQPINTGGVPVPTQFGTPTGSTSSISLSGLLSKLSLPGFSSKTGQSPFPHPSSFPGANYKSAFQPAMPSSMTLR